MYTAILIAHLVIAVTLIGLVLLQHGKGADAGAAFGSGASATVFGARGSTSFLSKVTTLFAAGFFGTSLVLAMLAGSYRQPHSVIDRDAGQSEPSAPQQESPPAQTTPEALPGPAPDTAPAPPPP
ncbi:MAG: preprotein translocase subunit SecG [Nitrococcus mobilis]|nr:preprotein translocase subunit SecG [Nitrococcus mobilis]